MTEMALIRGSRSPTRWLGIVPLAALLLCSCTVRFISEYDEVLDSSLSELQTRTEVHLERMLAVAGTPEGAYAANRAFYDEALAAVRTAKVRAEVTPMNAITIEQLGLLEQSLVDVRKLHEGRADAGLSKPLIEPARELLRIQFRSILKLEIAKRRGADQ